jgi:hypothetical protein
MLTLFHGIEMDRQQDLETLKNEEYIWSIASSYASAVDEYGELAGFNPS